MKYLLKKNNFCYYLTGTSDKLIDAIDLLKERAEDDDPNALFALVNDLAKVTRLPYYCELFFNQFYSGNFLNAIVYFLM